MRKIYSIPVPIHPLTRRLTSALVSLCLAACASDNADGLPGDEGDTGTKKGSEVTVVIASPDTRTRAINENTGEAIRTVRIYAYEHGVTDAAPVGYLEDNNVGTGVSTYKMEVKQRGQLDFIALLNDGGANQTTAITLNENTTLAQLNTYRIGRQLQEYGTGSGDYAIPMSTLEGTNGANRTFTITETTAPQYVNLTATRAMSRLRLYFAKADLGENEVKITSATLTQGPLSVRLMAEETQASLPDDGTYFDNAKASDITVVDPNSPVEVREEILDPDNTKITTENTQLVATAYMPENPYGASNKHDSGINNGEYDGTGTADSPYLLTVNYQAGTGDHKKLIYLPAVQRNQTVNIFGLLRGNEVKLYVKVADWDVENVALDNYPTYSSCGQAEEHESYSTTAQYVKVNDPDYVTDSELKARLKAAFACTFNMTAPEGLQFTPTLTGGGEGRFELMIFRAGTKMDVSECVGDPHKYTIYVIPTESYDTDNPAVNTVDLLITTQTWAGQADPLLINLDRKWNAGENESQWDDRIRITQISDISTSDPEGGEEAN